MENGDDLIYRQAAIDALEKAMCEDGFRSSTGLIHKTTAYEIIRHLPSVQPEQRRVDVENVLALLDGIHSSGRMEYYSDYCALYDAIAGLLPG